MPNPPLAHTVRSPSADDIQASFLKKHHSLSIIPIIANALLLCSYALSFKYWNFSKKRYANDLKVDQRLQQREWSLADSYSSESTR